MSGGDTKSEACEGVAPLPRKIWSTPVLQVKEASLLIEGGEDATPGDNLFESDS